MYVWRLMLSRYRQTALRGLGAGRYGGRWNSMGTPMVYASSSLELAVLETMVHAHPEQLAQAERCWVQLELPDERVETLDSPPQAWDAAGPYIPAVQAVGDTWIESQRSLALSVPASVLPERRNILLNPRHPRIAEVREVASALFTWPRRLADYLQSLGQSLKEGR